MKAKPMFVHALSPLHAGTGQGVGVIDLPIAREKATQIPFLPGSTIKGVFRDACSDHDGCVRVFGPKTDNASEHAGAVTFTDARLLLLPARSLRGVFAWVTSPLLLRRLTRDINCAECPTPPAQIPVPASEDSCLIADSGSALPIDVSQQRQVVLEDLSLAFSTSRDVTSWAEWIGNSLFPNDEEWKKTMMERMCVVPDNVLSFLLETGTEITARIRLQEDKKTVAQGALWYEEALPTETILAGLVVAAGVKAEPEEVLEMVQSLSGGTLQFGGSATVGRGLCRVTLT
jgi:CRISPR-associated protein Cmr4